MNSPKLKSLNQVLPVVAIATGFALLTWPLYAMAESVVRIQTFSIPLLLTAVVPVGLLLFASEIIQRTFNPRLLAIVAALAAVGMIVRLLGAGVAGLEPIWTVVLLAGLGLGPAAGYLVGILAILLSGLMTGGVGPWLPYQMLAAGLLGLIGGLIPSYSLRKNRVVLFTLGLVAGIAYGWLLNLWFWPTAIGLEPSLAFNPEASVSERFSAWIRFNVLTSFGFDLPRGLLTGALLAWIGPRLLTAIRRAARLGKINLVDER